LIDKNLEAIRASSFFKAELRSTHNVVISKNYMSMRLNICEGYAKKRGDNLKIDKKF